MKGETLDPFECSAIQCVIERNVDTGDDVRDYKFTPSDTEKMIINEGRARVFINSDKPDFAFAAYNPEPIELSVPRGAASVVAGLATSAFALLLAAF